MISQENLIEKETIIFKDLSDILGPNVHEQSFVFKGFIFGICTKGYIIMYHPGGSYDNGLLISLLLQHPICRSLQQLKHVYADIRNDSLRE